MSTKRISRSSIKIEGPSTIAMPRDATILGMNVQNEVASVSWLAQADAPCEPRKFITIGITKPDLDDAERWTYVGTFELRGPFGMTAIRYVFMELPT